jgi:hypothetical protein
MRQTWVEQGENEVAYLELVRRQRAGIARSYTPYREVLRWKKFFWWAIGLNVLQVGIIWYLVLKSPN